LPHKRPKGSEQSNQEKKYNQALSRFPVRSSLAGLVIIEAGYWPF
jgi:hypothetical protein